MQKDNKIRVYVLARELNLDSKDLLDICQRAGIEVKNQLSNLEPEQRDMIVQLVQKKGSAPPVQQMPKPAAVVDRKIRVLAAPTPAHAPAREPAKQESQPAQPQPATIAAQAPGQAPPATIPPATPATPPSIGTTPPPREHAPRMRTLTPMKPRGATPPSPPAAPSAPAAKAPTEPKPDARPPRSRGVAPPILATPPKPRAQAPLKDEKKTDQPAAQKPIAKIPLDALRNRNLSTKDMVKEIVARAAELPAGGVAVEEEEEESPARRAGAVKGREDRHKKRTQRAKDRRATEEPSGRIRLGDDDDDGAVRGRLLKRQRQTALKRGTVPRSGKVPLALPITVRSFCEAVGIKANDVMRKLVERGEMLTINSSLASGLAEEIALDLGFELEIKKPQDAEEQTLTQLQAADQPDDLVPRAPIVTIMGHVDHGKTSLLDRIRESNVVATEAGGITQHLRAWRVEHNGHPITFLDTPGHEAFTQMRARGAQVTDIVVLVVAADDGLMPQTEEAISHAKAANVPIVVAINKVDLPNANLNKARQQLYSQGLLPDDMGGDSPFVETVATKEKAKGIDQLLESILLVAELAELKANPKRPGTGTCLEAKLSEGEGVVATLLVQNGTLNRGDVILCGLAYGRARAMYDDLGRPIEAAGPGVPVRITGLDEVPNADDKFFVLTDLAVAREIVDRRRQRARTAQPVKHATFRLEDLAKIKVAEIKLILKADVRGSIEAIKKELEKLQHEEVKINLLHAGIGAITEGDVQLALASPEDTLIVGFNVVPDDRANSMADDKGVQIRQYDIIYKMTDDLRAALEGKLKPIEEVVHLGRAVVRKTFKISRVGTVAGCYVTQGTIERSARVRLIREGVVIYPPPDRVATIETLKRVKDDAREVREGYECGIKIAGYDDVKVDDVIEAFRVEQIQRTL